LLALSSRDRELTRVLRTLDLKLSGFSSDTVLGNSRLYSSVMDILRPSFNSRYSVVSPNFLGIDISGVAGELARLSYSSRRSAYEVIRSDVGSMRRLRVTKGICLPSDYPIHLVCGSKDVIHS